MFVFCYLLNIHEWRKDSGQIKLGICISKLYKLKFSDGPNDLFKILCLLLLQIE